MYDPVTEIQKDVLANGLEVYSIYWDRPWVKVGVVIHAASREDLPGKTGLAHFVEHVVSENIPHMKHSTAKQFIESTGGRSNFGVTGYLSTKYGFAIPATVDLFRATIRIFGSMLIQAEIKKMVERERQVIQREFNERFPIHERLEWKMAAHRSLFKGHRFETYSRPLGRPEDFLSITTEELQEFYDRYYVPQNMSLIVIGGLRREQIVAELESSPFGLEKVGERNLFPKKFTDFVAPTEQLKKVKLSDYTKLKIDQTEYCATWALPIDYPWEVQLIFSRIADHILAQEVRGAAGLSYGMRTDYYFLQDACKYWLGGMVSPKATDQINEIVRKCISMIPERKNLFQYKHRIALKKFVMFDLSAEDLLDDIVDNIGSVRKIFTHQERHDLLKAVTFDQVVDLANFLSAERQHTLLICP